MSTASDILRPGYRTLVCSSIWLVDVVNVEKQICAIGCWAGTGHLDSFRGNEGSKFYSVQFLENPSSSPASQPTVLHFTAQLETAALRHKLCSTTCSNRWAQFTYWNEKETSELSFCYTKHFWTLYKLSNGALEVTWNRVRDAREQENCTKY